MRWLDAETIRSRWPWPRIAAQLRDLACGTHPGRTNSKEITVFKSVGFALEDLAAADAVFEAEQADTTDATLPACLR